MFRSRTSRLAALIGALMVAVAIPASLQSPASAQALNGGERAIKLAELYNAGMMFFEGGKYEECVKKLEEFLGMLTEEEKQKTPLTYLTLGEAYYRLGKEDNFNKAIAYWNEFLRRWPADPKCIEVKVAIAQTYMQMKKWETAISWWVQVENVPAVRENSLTGQAYCYRQLKKPEDEITVLERLVYPDFNTSLSAEGAVRLMSLYALKHDPADSDSIKFADKAIELLKKLQNKTHLVENFIALNGIAIKLGDELLDVNAFPKALEAYWAVRPRDVVAKMQRERIAAMELRLDQNMKAAGKDPIALSRAVRVNDEIIKPRLEEAKKILADFEKLPDFMPALYFRMARCHADMNKKWEAIVVFNQILEDFPKTPLREVIIFSRLALYSDLGVAVRTYNFCDEYLQEFPKGPHAGEVGYIKGITAMRKQDWYSAEKYFEAAQKILGSLPDDQKRLYWTEVRYQLGNSRFLQNKFEQSKEDFESFIGEFGNFAGGKGAFMEDAEYQLALTHLFLGHYEKDIVKGGGDGAIERLQAHIAKWGEKSNYASDAKYRLAVCRFAASENDLCVKECEEWLATFGKDEREILQPEVYALLGDARAALKQHKESAEAYIESYRRATTDEVLNYSLFEAGKQLQKAGDWEGIERLYTDFVKERPEHQATVTAIYWVGKAKAKLGRMEEAKELAIQTLQKHIGEPKREGIEMILIQLAEWSRRRPPVRLDASSAPPEPAKWDAEAELERMVKPLREKANSTTEARLLFASAELHRMSRRPEERVELFGKIANETKAEDLSPYLLMEIGDFVFAKGEVDKAEALYRALKENYPKAANVDASYVGLGDVAFARKDMTKAMSLYTHAIDRLGAPYKLKEATLGQAKCYLEMAAAKLNENATQTAEDMFAKARKLFEEVASVREWRGESTAYSLFQIADIQMRQKKWKEATALFERVAVTQTKYPSWAARSYLKASEGYFRQGKDDLAKERLKEMLAKEKLQDLPEAGEAKKKLTELGGSI